MQILLYNNDAFSDYPTELYCIAKNTSGYLDNPILPSARFNVALSEEIVYLSSSQIKTSAMA